MPYQLAALTAAAEVAAPGAGLTITGIAGALREFGKDGAIAVLMVLCLTLLTLLIASWRGRVADARSGAGMLERVAAAMTMMSAALESRKGVFEEALTEIKEGEANARAAREAAATDRAALHRSVDAIRSEVDAVHRDIRGYLDRQGRRTGRAA